MVVNNIVILVGFFRKDKFSRIAVSQIFREVLFLQIRAFFVKSVKLNSRKN